MILRCLRGESIPIYGNGDHVRDWLYVTDHCEAIRTVFEKGKIKQTYNIGGDNQLTNLDVAKRVCKALDQMQPRDDGKSYQKQITFVEDRPGHDQRYAIDASKIKNELGWEPQVNLESGFQQTIQWYLENRSWWEAILTSEYQLERLGLDNGGM